MGLAWMIIVFAVFVVFVPLVSFWGSPSPKFGIFDRGHWQVCLSNLSNGIRTNIKGFLSRNMFFFVVEHWVYRTFVELKFGNVIYKKGTDNEKNPAKLGTGATAKIMLIKYTGASVVTGVYGERFASVLGLRNSFKSLWCSLGILRKSWKVAGKIGIEIFMNRVWLFVCLGIK